MNKVLYCIDFSNLDKHPGEIFIKNNPIIVDYDLSSVDRDRFIIQGYLFYKDRFLELPEKILESKLFRLIL